jgi:uncharacterized phage protein (predicted DNA packaging)
MDLNEVKTYLRVDGDAEDALITSFMTAATQYVNTQTGKTQVKTGEDSAGLPVYGDIDADALWCLAVKLLVTHWYENRGPEVVGRSVVKISHSVDALINHIAMCGDYV